MFDFAEKNAGVIKVILGAIALSFVGFGAVNYSSMSGSDNVAASVGGQKITRKELFQTLQSQQLPESAAQMVLDNLLKKHLLLSQAADVKFIATEAELLKSISTRPEFQSGGRFNEEKYRKFLKENNYTVAEYETAVKQDLMLKQMLGAYYDSGFFSDAVLSRLNQQLKASREIQKVKINLDTYTQQVSVSDTEIAAYYEKHKTAFQLPDRVKAEYVIYSAESLLDKQTVADNDIQAFYEKNKKQYEKEERQASHILIKVDANASAEQKAAAKSKIDALLVQVKKDPKQFAVLAKTHSDDPGSKDNGGDLGFNAVGVFVKPFDDALFKLKQGEISNVIETQFGYHIILCQNIRQRGLNEAKLEIQEILKKQKASKAFAENTEKLKEMAFQQPDSLDPLVKAFGLIVQQSDWSTKKSAATPALNKALEALFSEDVLQKKHNTDAIEIGDNRLLVARVKAFEPAHLRTLTDAKSDIVNILKKDKGLALAQADADSKVKALTGGQVLSLTWEAPETLHRMDAQMLPDDLIRKVFAVDGTKFPAYVTGKLDANSVVLIKINSAKPADDTSKAQLLQYLQQSYLQTEGMKYIDNLQNIYPVKVYIKPTVEQQ